MAEQTDNPVVDAVDDVIPDAVTETADHPVSDDVPPKWAEPMIESLEKIADKVAGVTEHETHAEREDETHSEREDETHAEPEHESQDESPVSKPWTHSNPFSRGE